MNTISLKSVGKVLSIFILVSGILLGSCGITLFTTGETGLSRYKKSSGKLALRFFSEKE